MKLIKTLLTAALLSVSIPSLVQAAQIVHDPTTAANVMSSVNTMNSMLSVTNQMESRLEDLNTSIGSSLGALGNPLLTAVQLFGRCSDPFAGLRGAHVGMGYIRPNFDFCNLIEGQKAYTSLLYENPLSEENVFNQRLNEGKIENRGTIISRVLHQASVNTLAIAAQQKQGLNEMRKRVVALAQKAESSPNLREDMRINNQLQALIANELIQARALHVHQAEIQGVLVAANPIFDEEKKDSALQQIHRTEKPYVSRNEELNNYYLGLLEKEADMKLELKNALFEKELRKLQEEINTVKSQK